MMTVNFEKIEKKDFNRLFSLIIIYHILFWVFLISYLFFIEEILILFLAMVLLTSNFFLLSLLIICAFFNNIYDKIQDLKNDK